MASTNSAGRFFRTPVTRQPRLRHIHRYRCGPARHWNLDYRKSRLGLYFTLFWMWQAVARKLGRALRPGQCSCSI
jgi:hypothetical protein